MYLNAGTHKVTKEDEYITHDPMCELFPTEVGCSLRYGATTGAVNRSDFLCILWLWWALLFVASVLAIFYRLARMHSPYVSWSMLKRHVPETEIPTHVMFGASDFFVLDRMAQNLDNDAMEKVLKEIEKELEAQAPKSNNMPLLPLYYPN